MLAGWTFFDQVMLFVLILSIFVTTCIYFYTHPPRNKSNSRSPFPTLQRSTIRLVLLRL